MKSIILSALLAMVTTGLLGQEHEWNNYAGLPGQSYYGNGFAIGGQFRSPVGIAIASDGTVYVSDESSHHIRKISPAGQVSVLAGNPMSSNAYGLVNSNNPDGVRFQQPLGMALGPDGNLYVADRMNNAIRKVTPAGATTTFLGNGAGEDNGTLATARLGQPFGLCFDSAGNMYIADTSNDSIRKVDPSGNVTTLAGRSRLFNDPPGPREGTGTAALFDYPKGVVVGLDGNIYVADTDNHVIRKVTPEGVVTTLAGAYYDDGNYSLPTHADGTGAEARFRSPTAITLDADGSLLVTDYWNHAIRRVTTAGVVTTIAGGIQQPGNAVGNDEQVRFSFAKGIARGPGNTLYVVDSANSRIIKRTLKTNGISLSGNSVNIPHGGAPALAGNHTNFGTIKTVGGSKEATFTITNNGTSVINFTGSPRVRMEGFRKDSYTVTLQPPASLAVGASTTFKVLFDAAFNGDHHGVVVIENDAPNHPVFTFALLGRGDAPPPPDTTKPTISIQSPAKNGMVFSSPLVLSGIASDDTDVTQVAVRLNGDTIGDATRTLTGPKTYSFTRNINLTSAHVGKNTLSVTAYDSNASSGVNYSSATVTFTYDPRKTLTVTRTVPAAVETTPDIAGTVALKATPSKNAKASVLPGGVQTWGITETTPVVLTATAKNGYLFSHWSGLPGGAQENANAVSFTTGSSDIPGVRAHFIANPFIRPAGTPVTTLPEINWGDAPTLAGIIQPAPGNTTNAAVAQVTATVVAAKATLSGKVLVDGQTTSFKGLLKGNGTVAFLNGKTYTADLPLKGNGAAPKRISQATWTATGMVFRLQPNTAVGTYINGDILPAAYRKKKLVPDESGLLNVGNGKSGYYTLILPAQSAAAASTFPQGPGYATLTLANNGTLKLAGQLADGNKITASSFLVSGDKAPFFLQFPTPGGKTKDGTVLGNLVLAATEAADISGTGWRWIRPAVVGTKITLYPAGWPQGIALNPTGGRYDPTQTVQQILSLGEGDATEGNATVLFEDGKLSVSSSSVAAPPFNIVASKVTRLTKTPGFTLTITPKTGLFKGTFTPVWDDPAKLDKKLPAYQGVLLQKEFRYGAGYFHSNQKGDTASEAGEVSLQNLTED